MSAKQRPPGRSLGGRQRDARHGRSERPDRSGDRPAAVLADDEAEGEQALEVDGRTAVGPPQLVALDTPVAQPAVGPPGEPRQAALDHGSPPPVDGVEVVGRGLGPGGEEMTVMGMQHDDPPLARVVQRLRSGQVLQLAPKVARPLVVRATVIPAGQVSVAASSSISKSSRSKPPGTAGRNGGGLMTALLALRSRWSRNSPVP